MQRHKPQSGLRGLLVPPILGAIATAIVFSFTAVMPAAAMAKTSRLNATSATTALKALRTYDRRVLAEVRAARARVEHYVTTAESQCPGVLGPLNGLIPANSNVSFAQMSLRQIQAAMQLAGQPAFMPAYRQLRQTLSGLGWSSRAPANAVRHLVADAQRLYSLKPSNLCGGLNSMVADLLANGNASIGFVRSYTQRARALARAERQFTRTLKPDALVAAGLLDGQLTTLEAKFVRAGRSLEKVDIKGLLSQLGLPALPI